MASVKGFFKRKNIIISVDRYLIKAMSAMALGLFASLLCGVILDTIGSQLGIEFLVEAGGIAKSLAGPAIGVAVAHGLQAPPLVLFASVITGAMGYTLGGPAGSFVAAVFGAEFGKMISKETPIDIMLTPIVTILIGFVVAKFIGPPIDAGMKGLGNFVMWATDIQPFFMGIIVSVVVGIVLTLPISSAALCMMMGLSGLAAGAATVGCCAQMVGFAVMSFRENRWNGLLAQGLGTSMLQVPNIVRNPRIWIPPTLTAAILGPLSTLVFKMQNIPEGAGMGTSGLVGQFTTINTMGATPSVFIAILLLHFILPGVITYVISIVFRKTGWIKEGDLKLDV